MLTESCWRPKEGSCALRSLWRTAAQFLLVSLVRAVDVPLPRRAERVRSVLPASLGCAQQWCAMFFGLRFVCVCVMTKGCYRVHLLQVTGLNPIDVFAFDTSVRQQCHQYTHFLFKTLQIRLLELQEPVCAWFVRGRALVFSGGKTGPAKPGCLHAPRRPNASD